MWGSSIGTCAWDCGEAPGTERASWVTLVRFMDFLHFRKDVAQAENLGRHLVVKYVTQTSGTCAQGVQTS